MKLSKNFSAILLLLVFFYSDGQIKTTVKPTICLLGGTPSSAKVLDEIPDDLKAKYNFISFSRPGFGGTDNETWNETRLYELASQAGLKNNDFAVIGVSGGGPLAILLANKFHLKHCGIVSGMVPAKEYFAYADSTFTKPLMASAVKGFNEFKTTIESFPNVGEILKQAESPLPVAIRASYDDLHFILADLQYDKTIFSNVNPTWLHGENDKNVALKSAQLFLSNFKKSDLTVIPAASHDIDGRILVRQLIEKWEKPIAKKNYNSSYFILQWGLATLEKSDPFGNLSMSLGTRIKHTIGIGGNLQYMRWGTVDMLPANIEISYFPVSERLSPFASFQFGYNLCSETLDTKLGNEIHRDRINGRSFVSPTVGLVIPIKGTFGIMVSASYLNTPLKRTLDIITPAGSSTTGYMDHVNGFKIAAGIKI